ncbi:hypothetical protein A8146_10155 [Mesorhizobium loti]|nr:hypothetical protein A8146_10155 [Mesorhizobium loti]
MTLAAGVIMALVMVLATIAWFLQEPRIGDQVSAKSRVHIGGQPGPVVVQGAARENEGAFRMSQSDRQTFIQTGSEEIGPGRIDEPLVDVVEAGGEIDIVKWKPCDPIKEVGCAIAIKIGIASLQRNANRSFHARVPQTLSQQREPLKYARCFAVDPMVHQQAQ